MLRTSSPSTSKVLRASGQTQPIHQGRAQRSGTPNRTVGLSATALSLKTGLHGRGAATTPIRSALQDHYISAVPTSARSTGSSDSSVAGLESTISEIMGVRMQSLQDLRQRVDQLSQLYRREEETFKQQMRMVLDQSEVVRVANETREQSLEAALVKERQERSRIMGIMSQFKQEGAAVIQVMKESLREATTKWKNEVDRNAKLTAQLRKLGGVLEQSSRSSSHRSVSAGQGSLLDPHPHLPHDTAVVDSRVETLTKLLEEEDDIILELQRRNKSLEQKLFTVTQQRDKLAIELESGGDGSAASSPDYQEEQRQLQHQIRVCDAALQAMNNTAAPTASTSAVTAQQMVPLLKQKCVALDRFSKLLMQRLLVEQRQRLRVEEQGARIATAQDQLVQKLEERLKELEGGAVNTRGGVDEHRRPRGSMARSSGAAAGASPTGRLLFDDAEKGGTQLLSPAPGPSEDVSVEEVHGDFEPLPPASRSVSSAQHQRQGPQEQPPAVPKRMLSLEEQLALVSNEFKASVDEWNEVMSAGARRSTSSAGTSHISATDLLG